MPPYHLRDVQAGQDRGLSGATLRTPCHAQCRIGREKDRPSALLMACIVCPAVAVGEGIQCRRYGGYKRLDRGIIITVVNAVNKNQVNMHGSLRFGTAEARIIRSV